MKLEFRCVRDTKWNANLKKWEEIIKYEPIVFSTSVNRSFDFDKYNGIK